MEPKPHTLDAQITRQEEPYGPLPTFHYAQTQDFSYTLAVDAHVFRNFISVDLFKLLNLIVRRHPEPYVIEGGHHIISQCRLPFRVGSYEDELWCDVVGVKSISVILGREWIT